MNLLEHAVEQGNGHVMHPASHPLLRRAALLAYKGHGQLDIVFPRDTSTDDLVVEVLRDSQEEHGNR
eukprot:2130058-Alexandrium_andersonii.AAC.1